MNPFYSRGYYNPKCDGTLDEYVRRQEEHSGTSCLFNGVRQFNLLWGEGFILPGRTAIRMMYNVGRGDEHYVVRDRETLVGAVAGAHSGKPGIFPVRAIIKNGAPPFEARPLRRKPENMTRQREFEMESLAARILFAEARHENLVQPLTIDKMHLLTHADHQQPGMILFALSLHHSYNAYIFDSTIPTAKTAYAWMSHDADRAGIKGEGGKELKHIASSGIKDSLAYVLLTEAAKPF